MTEDDEGFARVESVPEPHMRELEQGIHDDIDWTEPLTKFDSQAVAPNNTQQTREFLRDQIESNTRDYFRKCLILQRKARRIPPRYPTALSAAQATPKEERVYDRDKWRGGMVGFSYNPRISGTAGHVFFVSGRKDNKILTITNDARKPGEVSYVYLDFYERVWNHRIQFAATMLNDYDFSDFNEPPKSRITGSLGEQYKQSLDNLKAIRRQKREKYGPNHPLVLALSNDIERMQKTWDAWKAKS